MLALKQNKSKRIKLSKPNQIWSVLSNAQTITETTEPLNETDIDLLGKSARPIGGAENLVIEHREIQSQTQSDGVSGC